MNIHGKEKLHHWAILCTVSHAKNSCSSTCRSVENDYNVDEVLQIIGVILNGTAYNGWVPIKNHTSAELINPNI